MKARWKNQILAESAKTIVIEGNHYFPPESVNMAYFKPNSMHTICPWKGEASYYDVVVAGDTNIGAAWYYSESKDAAKEIKGYIAFWKGVEVGE